MSTHPASHGLKYHARAIAAQADDGGASCWMAGTTVLTEENEIQVLRLDGEKDRFTVVQTVVHPCEIWSISPNPSDPNQFATIFNHAIWSKGGATSSLKQVADLSNKEDDIRSVLYSPAEISSVVTCSNRALTVWHVSDKRQEVLHRSPRSQDGSLSSAAARSPKEPSQLCTSSGGDLQVWDLRTMEIGASKEKAHSALIRSLDFAHNDSQLLASCGNDCRVKIWDMRSFRTPVISFSNHAHWVWQCKFNPSHDQLLLSSSSDAMIHLNHMPKLGKTTSKSASPASLGNGQWPSSDSSCAAVFDTHEDSVYGVAWSAVDTWLFASVSYDGRIAVGRVPSNVKYSILI